MAARQPQTTGVPPVEATSDPGRTAELEAENAALKIANAALHDDAKRAGEPRGSRAVWLVTYPAISVFEKRDGVLAAEPIVLKRGDVLPPDCEWHAEFLASIGHIASVTVPA